MLCSYTGACTGSRLKHDFRVARKRLLQVDIIRICREFVILATNNIGLTFTPSDTIPNYKVNYPLRPGCCGVDSDWEILREDISSYHRWI